MLKGQQLIHKIKAIKLAHKSHLNDRNDVLVGVLNSDYGIIMNSRYDHSDASLTCRQGGSVSMWGH